MTAAPVLLLTHEFAPFRGGVATYVHELAAAAVDTGERVEVWTVEGRRTGVCDRSRSDNAEGGRRKAGDEEKVGSGTEADSSLSYPVVRLSSDGRLTPAGLGRLAWGLWRARARWQGAPVALMSVGAQMVFFVLDLWPGLVDPRWVTPVFYGSEVLRFGQNAAWRWLARRFYRRAAGVGVTSRYVEGLLRESGLLPEGARVTMAACALPRAFVEGAEGAEVTGSAADDGTWRVLTVARLHPRKGQADVARALGRLPEAVRARLVYQVVGVGAEDYRQQVAAEAARAEVRVEFLGGLDDAALTRTYARATVYAQASRTLARSVEGFGITFLEASFHGLPVAAYRTGGVGEAVRDGETGLLVPEGDEAALAAAVGRLLADVDLRRRIGAAGRRFARSLRWEDAARALCAAARGG